MSAALPRILAALLATGSVAAGLDAASAAPRTNRPAAVQPAPTPPPEPPGDRLRTSDEVKRESLEGAVTTPLRDLNVDRVEIPEVLRQAITDPYARPPRNARCSQLIALIRPLDDALGPDIDQLPPPPDSPTERSSSAALGAAADLASGAIIPFRSVVRTLSGAASHDKLVQAAIIAGHTRRAYLKGLGEARGCPPPATPSHDRAGSPPIPDDRRGMPKPKYPIR
jgi:hypothetical protein